MTEAFAYAVVGWAVIGPGIAGIGGYLRGRRDGRIDALASIEALKALLTEAATRKET